MEKQKFNVHLIWGAILFIVVFALLSLSGSLSEDAWRLQKKLGKPIFLETEASFGEFSWEGELRIGRFDDQILVFKNGKAYILSVNNFPPEFADLEPPELLLVKGYKELRASTVE